MSITLKKFQQTLMFFNINICWNLKVTMTKILQKVIRFFQFWGV